MNDTIETHDKGTPPTAVPGSFISDKLLQHSDRSTLEGDMQIAAQDSGYNSSGSSGRLSPTDVPSGGASGGELTRTRSRASSHSSISSLPDSTLTNIPDAPKPLHVHDSHDYTLQHSDHLSPRAVHTLRQRDTSFRRPSSVRAMQMHTEDEGDDYYHLTPPRQRGSGRTSDISIRSAGSLPFKRSPFYSPTGVAAKPKVKKEYPLVLLHCTLLSPSLPVSGLVGHPDRQKILKEVLPPLYWKRWKLLEDRIGSGVLRDRGVLISHPEDMYDLLEERLLESLELQHPRLDHGHFIGHEDSDSEKEEHSTREDSGTEDEGDECPDCGGRFVRQHTTRKWAVKVFAANGLMRAGAWAAAWKEMEKVDVEVGLWLPPDVRASLEKQLAEDSSDKVENSLSVSLLQKPENIPLRTSTPVAALPPSTPIAEPQLQARILPPQERPPSPFVPEVTPPQTDPKRNSYPPKPSEEIDLQTLLVNYIRVLASDPRNIAIVFLSVLVAYVAFNHHQAGPASELRPFPRFTPDYPTSSVVALQEPATQTWAEELISQTLSPAVSDTAAVLPSFAPRGTTTSLDDVSDVPVEPSLVEPEEVAPIESGTSSVESVEFAVEKEYVEEEAPEEPTGTAEEEPEELLSIATETTAAKSIPTNIDEEQQPNQSTGDEPNESLPTADHALSTEYAEFDTELQEQSSELSGDEPEELPPAETESPSSDATENCADEQEKPTEPSDDDLELPVGTPAEIPSTDSSDIMPEEEDPVETNGTMSSFDVVEDASTDQETPTGSSDDELDLPLPTSAETLSTDRNDFMSEDEKSLEASGSTPSSDAVEDASEDQENSTKCSEDESELPLPTSAETPSADSSDIILEEEDPLKAIGTTPLFDVLEGASENQENPTESSEDKLELTLETPAETPSTDSHDFTSEEEDPLEDSEPTSLEEPLSTTADLDDPEDEQNLSAIDQHNNNEQTDQDQQNEQHKPSELNEQNDENEI